MNEDLVLAVNGAFGGRGWQGPTLLGSLRGVSPEQALVVPARLRYGIWHQVLHAAYWKYAVCLRIDKAGVEVRGVPRGEKGEMLFPRSPSNHPDPPAAPSLKAWRADIGLLKDFHGALVDAVTRLKPRQLDSIPPGGRSWTLRPMIVGIAAHDAYHCGQVQMIKRLIRGGRGA